MILLNLIVDVFIVVYKNTLLDLKTPKQLLSQFLMPLQLCVVIYFLNYQKDSIISLLFQSMFPFYLGNLTSSLVRKFSVFFINQRQQKFGKYQRVLGLSTPGYFLGNLLYAYLFTAMIISPIWIILMYYSNDWELVYFFAAFVICGNCFMLMLISFFKDPKICSQVVGMICSLSVFLYYLVDLQNPTFYSYIIMMLPQPGFALSIIGHSKKASSMMLLSAKLFIVIYAWREFEIHPLHHCQSCIEKFKRKSVAVNEELQLESLDNSQAKVMQPVNIKRVRLLNINSLTKKYTQKVYALDNLSLSIAEGEILALLGRNGAGKTTLIDIITKMQEPTSGSVEFKKDLDQNKLGVCYQQQILYQQLTISQTVQYYIYVKRQKNTQLQRVLKLVQLFDDRYKKVKQLSGGMKRRLSLSIAIIGNPSILILDEPTSGLDPHSRRSVWQIIYKLKAQQKSILLTTHHLDQAEALSDRVCVIERGRLLVIGSPLFIKKKFGVGYFLTIYGSQQHIKQQQNIIQKYVSLQGTIVDKNTKKYILRMKDQQHFGKILSELQQVQGIEPTLQLNSLEQAFMGILNDPQITQNNQNHKIILPIQRSTVGDRHQLKAMFLKNFYLLKHSPLKTIILYNLNLIFLIIGIIVVTLFKHISKQAKDNIISKDVMNEQIASLMKSVMLLQGYYFSIGAYIQNSVYQKQKKIINVLKVRGLSWFYYWLAQFFIDYAFYLINLFFVFVLMKDVINIQFMMMFGFSIILYSYCCSFLFNKSEKATKYFPLLNFIVGLCLPLINQLQTSFLKQSLLSFFKYTYPFYSLQNTLVPIDLTQPHQHHIIPYIVQIILFFTILVLIQTKIISKFKNNIPQEEIDLVIKLNDVKKIYGNKQQALKSLNLEVQPSEVLGLLGPNGAGKSTTFKILTNLESPTSGEVYLEHRRHLPFRTTFQNSGVCYQDDTLWQTLTGKQILNIFGNLIGINDIVQQSLFLADRLEIQTLDRKFEKLSGGNKRKCCMAVCLMGQPLVSYLDQCSTGLDPMSRRAMVKTIGTHQNSTIVFTTHSMNQAQVLCKKVAILMKGQVKQYSNIKQLKDKYYPDYFCQIIYDNNTQNFIQEITKQLPKFSIKSQCIQQGKIKCSIEKSQIKLSKLYNLMMKLRKEDKIKDFSVYEPNLEDIYLQIIENGN